MQSVWEENGVLPEFDCLNKNICTDVLIIGGGLAGILCAYQLYKAGVDCVLVEAERICSGITKNTTAKITLQHGLIYSKLLKEFGLNKTKMYLEANQQALDTYKKMCENIDCDFEIKDSFVYSIDSQEKIIEEISVLKRLGYNAEFVKKAALPFEIAGAVKFSNQAQFNPLKFVADIVAKLRIYEHTKVNVLIGNIAVTKNNKITAKRIVVATHFPFLNKHGNYFIKLYQHRSYVIASANAADVGGMYVDESIEGLSFRNYKDLLLIGGGGHRTGKKGGAWQEINRVFEKFYPRSNEVYRWATQDCMTLDGIPYIGRYSKSTDSIYVITGFNKWGMTSSMVAAKLITDMLTGQNNEFFSLYDPSRNIFKYQLAVNAFEAITNIITPTTPRCPHLGCALKWNYAEHSWDCPCHGSRFTESGKLIDNPATDGIVINKNN